MRGEGVRFLHNQRLAPAEIALTLVAVVGTAPELNVLGRSGPPRRMRDDVMESQEGLLGASATGVGHKRAPSPVAAPDRALDRGREVPRSGGGTPGLGARPAGGGELLWNDPSSRHLFP